MVHKIAVVGGGIIGITTAVVVAENLKDVQVTVISDQWTPDTTGDGSAGFWAPYLLGDIPFETLKEWCRKSTEIFREIFQSNMAVECGVGLMPVYWIYSDQYNGTKGDSVYNELYLDCRQMSEKELSIFPNNYRSGLAMSTFFVECTKLLPVLMKRIQSKGGNFIEKKVQSFAELAEDYDVVLNCTGLGARHLVPDPEVKPIRGQVIKVRAPWIKHCVVIDDDHYIIPNSDVVVLGGTQQKDNWSREVDPGDKHRIWEKCTQVMPCVKDANIIRDWVGLRPYRHTPRVERECVKTGKGKLEVIHNYGHGGCGITLSWGCAYHVLGLLREVLEDASSAQKQGSSQLVRSKI